MRDAQRAVPVARLHTSPCSLRCGRSCRLRMKSESFEIDARTRPKPDSRDDRSRRTGQNTLIARRPIS